MINSTVLDNIIEAVGHNFFIDELLGRMSKDELISTINEIAQSQGLEVNVDGSFKD